MKRHSEAKKKKAVSMYRSGRTSIQVAEDLGVAPVSVIKWARKAGVQISNAGRSVGADLSKTTRLGRLLGTRRIAQGMTLEELGEKSLCHGPNVSRMERGEAMPLFSTVVRIAAALDLSLDELAAAVTLDEIEAADSEGLDNG